MSTRDIYPQILNDIRQQILAGEMPAGHKLPTETELANRHSVSRPTIARIYDALQAEGLVEKISGSGTYVIFRKPSDTLTIGLLLPGPGESEIFGPILEQITLLAEEKSIRCLWEGTLIKNAGLRKKQLLKICRNYIDNQVDGVLFSPLERTDAKDAINEQVCSLFSNHRIPVGLIDRDIVAWPARSRYDLTGIDNHHAAHTVTQHLIESGCKELYFISLPDSAPTVEQRIRGFKHAIAQAGIAPTGCHILTLPGADAETVDIGQAQGSKGIVCANDATAVLVMQILINQGIRIPDDVRLAGFDDMKYAAMLQVPLTTYRQPCADIGTYALEQLLTRIRNPQRATTTIALYGKLIQRKSSQNKS